MHSVYSVVLRIYVVNILTSYIKPPEKLPIIILRCYYCYHAQNMPLWVHRILSSTRLNDGICHRSVQNL